MYLNRSREVFLNLQVKDNFIINFWVVRSFKIENLLVWCTFPGKCCPAREHKEQLHTMLQCMINVKKKTPKTIQTWLEKSWWACSGTEEARLFLSVYLKSGGSYYICPPCTQRCQHEAIPSIWWVLRNFYWREVGTTDFQRKADSAWWASTQSWNPNTSASGTGEWAGTPSPARPISKVLLE